MIKRFDDMTTEQIKQWNAYYELICTVGLSGFKAMKPFEKFDSNGLRFPIEYLNTIGLNVCFFPLEVMAEYADVITVLDHNKPQYDVEISKMVFMIGSGDYASLNATSIGNMAYYILNGKDEKAKVLMEELINDVYKYQLLLLQEFIDGKISE